MFPLESPHRAILMSTHNIPISVYKKISLNYPKSGAKGFCSKGNEFETAVVNEPSVFEPLTFNCINTFDFILTRRLNECF